MGILNITPDSFSDGGQLYAEGAPLLDKVLARAEIMVAAGADILDVGGESTRPGAMPVSAGEELDRVVPVVQALKDHFDIPVSVDTSTPQVISASAAAGASMINDVRALERPGALEAAANTNLTVCLMHMQGEPGNMQQAPRYQDVVVEVKQFLQARVATCETAGIGRNRLVIDPGFGFGKTLAHNLALFRALPQFAAMGLPVLVGVSRKSMIGKILGDNSAGSDNRVPGSVALALLAVQRGASIVRVHDVPETVAVLKTLQAINGA